MTPDQLAQAFTDSGIDTPDKVKALLSTAGLQMRRVSLGIALEAKNAEQSAAVANIEAEKQALQGQIAATTAQILATLG